MNQDCSRSLLASFPAKVPSRLLDLRVKLKTATNKEDKPIKMKSNLG